MEPGGGGETAQSRPVWGGDTLQWTWALLPVPPDVGPPPDSPLLDLPQPLLLLGYLPLLPLNVARERP